MRGARGLTLVALTLVALAAAAVRAADESQPAPPAAAKEPAPPPSVTVIGAREGYGVLGRDVRSPMGEGMGHIVDVIVDRAGLVLAAVVGLRGFLRGGRRKNV